MNFKDYNSKRTERISRLLDKLFEVPPTIEADRAVIVTESYKETEGMPIILRRAKAFLKICEELPVKIFDDELLVGTNVSQYRSCQTFPEFSYEWLEAEFDTVSKRSADPFEISEETKIKLSEAYKYWKGKTTSELATELMAEETKTATAHNVFTAGNYFYNGVGHVTVNYSKILKYGFNGIKKEAEEELLKIKVSDADYITKSAFLKAVIISADAAITFSARYAKLALDMSAVETNEQRKKELLTIAQNCVNVPANGAQSFYEACQSVWFIQLLLQTESSGHSISPGRFDQYMYPYYIKDINEGKITPQGAQELIDNFWIKLNSINKVRDAASAEGFAGYSLFQNLIAGGQTPDGRDATNDLSFMCLQASLNVPLPQPSLSVRVWNLTPQEFLVKAAQVTKTGIGLPAYYNDEVIIPSLVNRGISIEEARDYNIIGCVEPQVSGKTEGWHDAAFFNMLKPMEFVFSNGMDKGELVGLKTGEPEELKTFDEFLNAYKKQMEYAIGLMVNANNSIDVAHAVRCPLPFESSMVDDCIRRGKSVQEGGAIYNFTGPQGFGIANVADALYAIKVLVYEQKKFTLSELKEALLNNFGSGVSDEKATELTADIVKELAMQNVDVSKEQIAEIYNKVKSTFGSDEKYVQIKELIDELPKYGNDIEEVDKIAREAAYTYTKPLETFKNPRGGIFQAGLYPVSANVPLGGQTGATPDGRLAYTPVADGVSPSAGKDISGPTAACNSVSTLDHSIASNGTLYNMKFHPSALEGESGIASFVALIRGYFDKKGSHVQFNVVSRETLIDAQKNPENYKSLVVRVAGYSALFTTLSKSLQDDIINRTEQGFGYE